MRYPSFRRLASLLALLLALGFCAVSALRAQDRAAPGATAFSLVAIVSFMFCVFSVFSVTLWLAHLRCLFVARFARRDGAGPNPTACTIYDTMSRASGGV